MRLTLIRERPDGNATPGVLFVDGRFECFTLEDVVRAAKVAGVTAIPAGRYRVIVSHSPRFRRRLPLLLDVPGFEGVRIHPGNTAADTEGCILVGTGRRPAMVVGSRVAFDALFARLEEPGVEAWLTILSEGGLGE